MMVPMLKALIMKAKQINRKKIAFPLIIMLLIITLVAVFKIVSVIFTLRSQYTEENWLEYQLLTPDTIKNAPRISENYLIKTWARDGNAPQVKMIEFYDVDGVERLEKYLTLSGYSPTINPLHGPVWISPDGAYSVYIRYYSNKTTLSILDERGLPRVNDAPFQDTRRK